MARETVASLTTRCAELTRRCENNERALAAMESAMSELLKLHAERIDKLCAALKKTREQQRSQQTRTRPQRTPAVIPERFAERTFTSLEAARTASKACYRAMRPRAFVYQVQVSEGEWKLTLDDPNAPPAA